jgi:hypothetical protein
MTEYWGASRIAAQLGVATGTIAKWIDRFADTMSPFPAPDVEVVETDDRVTRGWSPKRLPEIEQWARQDRYEVRRKAGTRRPTLHTRYSEQLSEGHILRPRNMPRHR